LQAAVVTAGHQEVCASCSIADTAFARMKGLLGRDQLAQGEGLLLRPASSVHTAFMRFPIDVAFLDRDMRVLKVKRDLGSWRMAGARGAKAVLELPAGECERQGIAPGVELSGLEVDGPASRRSWHRAVPPLAGAILAALALARFGFGAQGVLAAFFAAVLGIISAIDLERSLIPNVIVLPATVVVLVGNIALHPERSIEWLLAAAGAGLVLLVLTLIRPEGLGMGDVKLAVLLGAGLGKNVVWALSLGFLAVWPVALYLVLRHGRVGLKRMIPFAPLLALGSLVVLFSAGPPQ
jgi:uncharacterized membrane protein (UPF0127 family)/Flp pilus assembly protein protease CpaA